MTRMGLELPQKDVDELFNSWDPTGGGTLDFKELQKVLRPKPAPSAGEGLKKAAALQKAAKALSGGAPSAKDGGLAAAAKAAKAFGK